MKKLSNQSEIDRWENEGGSLRPYDKWDCVTRMWEILNLPPTPEDIERMEKTKYFSKETVSLVCRI
jgi:hypothetical protein